MKTMKELKEFIESMEAITAEQPVEEALWNDNSESVTDLLDEFEEALYNAVQLAQQLESTRELGNVVGAYTRPWLEAFLNSNSQTGSVPDLRGRLEDEEDDEY